MEEKERKESREHSRKLPDPAAMEQLLRDKGDLMATAILQLTWYAALSAPEIGQLKWSAVDFSNGTLQAAQRRVPMAPELRAFLSELPQKGPFVVASRRSGAAPFSRGSISRKVRGLLNAGGMSDLDLQDVRNAAILRFIQKYPIEEAARITGYDIRSLQVLYRRYVAVGPYPHHRKAKKMDFDPDLLQMALEKEGDVVGTRVVVLSWQGDLLLREMVSLQWKDVNLKERTWRISGKKKQIPHGILPYLRKWSEQESSEQALLRGVRSGSPYELAYLARMASEFFSRNGLERYTLVSIRGKGSSPKLRRQQILAYIQVNGSGRIAELSHTLGIPQTEVHRLLRELEMDGALRSVRSGGQRYVLPDVKSNREKIESYWIKKQGDVVTQAEVSKVTGIPQNLVNYYMRNAVQKGLLIRERQGVYRVQRTKEPELSEEVCREKRD